jgi:DNA-binding NarL/FixJ family response regulator
MPHLDWFSEEKNRHTVFLVSAVMILVIAAVDWLTKPYVSLGFLYLFPIMLAAAFLPRWAIIAAGLCCAVLSETFSSLDPSQAHVRMGFETLALAGCGLLVSELHRNRRLTSEAEEGLRILVETSPAAIVIVDDLGFIELANRAAIDLLIPRDGQLVGHPIAAFLPELHFALRLEEGAQFRASMQCRAHRGRSEPFLAEVWFSTFREGLKPKLAAIIAEVMEAEVMEQRSAEAMAARQPPPDQPRATFNNREIEVLRRVVQGLSSKEIGAQLDISESAVKNVLQQLFAKTDARARSQLVRVALERYRDLL